MTGCSKCGLCTDNIEVFKEMPENLRARISSLAGHFSLNPGEYLFHEGDSTGSIYILREGRMKLSTWDSEGKEYILDILVEGDILGEDNLFEKGEYRHSAIALSRVEYCLIRKEDIIDLMKVDFSFAMAMVESLSDKLKNANDRIRNLMEDDALRKVAAFLIARSERLGSDTIPLGIEDIAFSINLRRETVSRKIHLLADEGLVERHGQKSISISDREGLLNKVI